MTMAATRYPTGDTPSHGKKDGSLNVGVDVLWGTNSAAPIGIQI